MYHPNCSGNESNILDCPYSKQDSVPRSCSSNAVYPTARYTYSNYDVTSVICLPGAFCNDKYSVIAARYHACCYTQRVLLNQLTVKMEPYVWLDNPCIEAGWKYVKIMCGVQFVLLVDLMEMMQMLSAGFWAINPMVSR